jgi:hypothetical protein
MMRAVDRLAELLAADAGIGVPAGRIGAARPAGPGDLPALAVSVVAGADGQAVVGRLVREAGGRTDAAATLQGMLQLEIWAGAAAAVSTAARGVEQRLTDRTSARARGFIRLSPARLEAMEEVRRERAVGSPFAAWLQRLEYRFAFEDVTGETDGAGIIERIDVALDGQLAETLVIR